MSISRFMLKLMGLFVIVWLAGIGVMRTIGLTLRPDERTRVVYQAATGVLGRIRRPPSTAPRSRRRGHDFCI
jgi:hypothetical protein